MNDAWFYEEAGQTLGAVSFAELVSYLVRLGEWQNVLVWREGFADWKRATEVDELSHRLTRPPPLPRHRTPMTSAPKVDHRAQTNEPFGSAVTSLGSTPVAKRKKGSWVLKALGWVGLFVVACLARGIGGEFGKAVSGPSRAEQIETLLSKAEALARAELPKKLDDATTLAAVDHQGNRLRFHYVLEGNVPPTAIETVRPQAIADVCAKRATNGLDGGVSFEYIYRDKQSKLLGSYTVLKSDCRTG
jgi:hypothetical protein